MPPKTKKIKKPTKIAVKQHWQRYRVTNYNTIHSKCIIKLSDKNERGPPNDKLYLFENEFPIGS